MNNYIISENTQPLTASNEFFDAVVIEFADRKEIVALRSPDMSVKHIPIENKFECIAENDCFRLYKSGERLLCRIFTNPTINITISPISNNFSVENATNRITSSAQKLCHTDPYSYSPIEVYATFEDAVRELAEYCGCLTDISRKEDYTDKSFKMNETRPGENRAFLFGALTLISLMYRRISALRGYNFRFTYADGMPCFIFSADVILNSGEDSVNSIPEYNALSRLNASQEAIIVSRLGEAKLGGDTEDNDNIRRLFIAICTEGCDPRGILRAGKWFKHVKQVIDSNEPDIPGRF